MIGAFLRTFITVLVCSTLSAIPAHHSAAQTSTASRMPQGITGQRGLLTHGSDDVSSEPKKCREARFILLTADGAIMFGKISFETSKTRPQREKQYLGQQRIEAALAEEISRPREFGRKMLKRSRLIQHDMVLMMKDEKALSRAEKTSREGHGTLERGQKIVMTPRL